jgi:hypothetical protein
VKGGTGAEIEWTRELQTERDSIRLCRKSTVN